MASWNGFAARRLDFVQSQTEPAPKMGFDYTRPAALFLESRTGTGRPLGYRRFRSADEGIRFAVEDLPVTGMQVWLEVGNERLNQERIQQLYDSADYPLPRRDR